INHVINAAVILQRRCSRFVTCPAGVSSRYKCQAMRALGKGQNARYPRVAVGIESIVPAYRSRKMFAKRLVELNSAIDSILLVPQQTPVDVHVFKSESISRADQCR